MIKNKFEKIAIVKLSAMGDIIHAMIALQFIKKHYPNLIIDWFVQDAFYEILQHNPHINNIYKIDLKAIKKDKRAIFSQISLVKEYSKNNYDLIIDAQGLIKSALVSKFLGKNIAGFSKTSIREKFASWFYNIKVDIAYDENVIVRNTKVLSKPLEFDISFEEILQKEPFLYFKANNSYKEFFKDDKKNIVFVIGASWKSKIYSKEKIVKIVNALNENTLVVWGSQEEKEIASYICQNSCAKMLPRLSLNDLKELISKADLVIGNDTGPTHMAWALNVPSITLFGNTPGYRNTFTTSKNLVLESSSQVNPFKIDKNDFSISKIEEGLITKTARELLNETNY